MPTPVLINGGTKIEWSAENPILPNGFIGIESDTKNRKTGNGISSWNSIEYNYSPVNDSHNWGEQTAAEAGKGLHWFDDIKDLQYSPGNKYYSLKGKRTKILKYVILGDSSANALQHSTDPSPVQLLPIVLTVPAAGVTTFKTVYSSVNALQLYYPKALVSINCGTPGESVRNVLDRDTSGYAGVAGRSVTDIVKKGNIDFGICRIGVNDLFLSTTLIQAARTKAQNDAAYAISLANHKELIGRLAKTGVLWVYEGIAGYGGGYGTMFDTLADRQARAPYVLQLMDALSSYIESLDNANILYFDPRGVLCDATTGEFLSGYSSDGVHLSAKAGNVRAAHESAIVSATYGPSTPQAYEGENKLVSKVPPMYLTKVTNANGDIATGISLEEKTNLNVVCTIENVDGKLQQLVVATPINYAATARLTMRAIINATDLATMGALSTDTVGIEADITLEAINGVFYENNLANFEIAYTLPQTGNGANRLSYHTYFTGETKIKMHAVLPPFILGVDPATVGDSKVFVTALIGIGDTGATYKMAISNFRYVLNPTL